MNLPKAEPRKAFKRIISTFLFFTFYLSASLFPSPKKPSPLHHPIVEATSPSVSMKNRGKTSFHPHFNSRRLRPEISFLIVFNRIYGCVYTEEKEKVVCAGGENIYREAGRSSGWRATVRVSDQLTICRQKPGWFEPPVIRQKIWTMKSRTMKITGVFRQSSIHQRYSRSIRSFYDVASRPISRVLGGWCGGDLSRSMECKYFSSDSSTTYRTPRIIGKETRIFHDAIR